jgi:hypothetical protein
MGVDHMIIDPTKCEPGKHNYEHFIYDKPDKSSDYAIASRYTALQHAVYCKNCADVRDLPIAPVGQR